MQSNTVQTSSNDQFIHHLNVPLFGVVTVWHILLIGYVPHYLLEPFCLHTKYHNKTKSNIVCFNK